MKKCALLVLCLVGMLNFSHVTAQKMKDGYIYPTGPLVRENLEKWQDLKFGFIIHWGLYSVPGIMESWNLVAEDLDWIKRDTTMSYPDYKAWYWGLSRKFAPVDYHSEKWAAMAKEAGMKYMVFTTKHHEGFSMFDTRYSEFSIAKGPFKNNPKKMWPNMYLTPFAKRGL